MARKATETEERLLDREKILTVDLMGPTLPRVRVRVIYLGGNPHKTVRLKGKLSILREGRISIADLVTKHFGKDRKWAELLPDEQEQIRNELARLQNDVLSSDTIVRQEKEQFTTYDFSTLDALGRSLPYDPEKGVDDETRERYCMTRTGRRYQWVEHLGHIAELFRMVGEDGGRMFEIRCDNAEVRVIQEYIKASRSAVNPDSGAAVLADMGLSEKD